MIKKNMKKLVTLIGVAGVLFATNLYAGFVTLTEVGGNANGGGLFQAATTANGTFDTFCISINTTFYPGTQYSYDLSSTIGAYGIPPASSFIAAGTAYLYQQFSLGNVNYAGVGNANAVQAAIWYLQGDLSGTVDLENGNNLASLLTPILNQVQTDTGLTWAQQALNGNGALRVVAMNLYTGTDTSSYDQPQLAIDPTLNFRTLPVPEPTTMIAGALLLLPFGASTLRILRKR
jgi:hypothetical protein